MAETTENIETPVTEDASASLGNVKFGKGCDLDINITDSIDFGPGQFSVIARQKQYNESNSLTDDRSEETLMMNGGACYMRPATFVGNDLIGDAYMSAENAEATTVEVGGVKAGISKKRLMKEYHGSISEVLDAILFPDTDFKVEPPVAPKLSVDKTTVAHNTAMSSLTFTFENATTNNTGRFNFAKDTIGNIVKNINVYDDCVDPNIPADVKYGTSENSISTSYNADTKLTVDTNGADKTYYFQTSHKLISSKFTGDNALTPCSQKGVTATIDDVYKNDMTVNTNVAKVTVQAPFYYGSVVTGLRSDINNAANYSADAIDAIAAQVTTPLARTKEYKIKFTKAAGNVTGAIVIMLPSAFSISSIYQDWDKAESVKLMLASIGTVNRDGITYNLWTPNNGALEKDKDYLFTL